MIRKTALVFVVASLALALQGCGSSEPEHVEKPMAGPPARTASDFDKLTNPDDKIKFIENSKAPKAEKDRAIAMIKSGKM